MIKTVLGVKGQDAWIGLNDIEIEGTFVFIDGTKATQQNSGWRSGQPNNLNGIEDCAHVNIAGWPDNTANDAPCTIDAYALCEKPFKRLM